MLKDIQFVTVFLGDTAMAQEARQQLKGAFERGWELDSVVNLGVGPDPISNNPRNQILVVLVKYEFEPADEIDDLVEEEFLKDLAKFKQELAKTLNLDHANKLTDLGIQIRPVLVKGRLATFSIRFPISHNSIRNELRNIAWALRKSASFAYVTGLTIKARYNLNLQNKYLTG